MHFRRVCLESFGYTLPDEIVTTAELEQSPRAALRATALARRPARTDDGHSRAAVLSAAARGPARSASNRPDVRSKPVASTRRYFGALIHGSVCRDFLEPATACRVHHGLDLPSEAMIYDVSNACLGLLNGIVQVASMIELGQIRAGVVVGTECGRELVENTIELLNARYVADARLGQKLHRLAHDRRGQRGDRAMRRRAEPNRQSPDDGGRALRHEPARSLPKPRPGNDHADRQRRADAARHRRGCARHSTASSPPPAGNRTTSIARSAIRSASPIAS